jgi:plastocyanin
MKDFVAFISVVIFALFAVFAAPVYSQNQTFCQKYAQALFGADNLTTELDLITAVVDYTAGNVAVAPQTTKWFNGKNNGFNFLAPQNSAALATLIQHLIAFFGNALGCVAPGYPPVVNPNMKAIHTFPKPIDKSAYEYFNQVVLGFAYTAGVQTADLYSLATALDTFRNGGASGVDQVCQASDCNKAPFTVLLADFFFNPPYYSVPVGGALKFVVSGESAHTATQGVAFSSCTTASKPVIDKSFTKQNQTATTPALSTAGNFYFYCKYHCGIGMYGQAVVA